jgi:glycine/D-amino acid oxidase-like deaminating enzyme
VVVVGNGILGLSLTLACARAGMRTVLVGQAGRPYGATAASGAMLGCFAEVTKNLLMTKYGQAKLEAGLRARRLWPRWLAELGELTGVTDLLVAEDTVVLLNTVSSPAIDDAGYAAIRTALTEYNEPYEDIDPAEIDWLDPDPLSRPLRAMLVKGEGAVDSSRLLTTLELALHRLGVAVVAGQVASVIHDGARARGVLLASGEKISADQVVLAGGAQTQLLLDQIPSLVPRIPRLVSGLGVSCIVRPHTAAGPATVLRTPNRSFACGLHLIPRSHDMVYIGATNAIHFTPKQEPYIEDATFLLDCAVHQMKRELRLASIVKLQSGNRPASLDGFPLVGQTSVGGLWILSGTYRDGLHMSPLLVTRLVECMQAKAEPDGLDLFTPEREPIQELAREEVIRHAATHITASGYERDWRLPVDWPPTIEDLFFDRCLTFAYSLSDTYTPPAETLVALLRAPAEVREQYRRHYRQVRKEWGNPKHAS